MDISTAIVISVAMFCAMIIYLERVSEKKWGE